MRSRLWAIPLLAAAVVAQASLAPGAAQPQWLAGSWCSEKNGERIEEVWLAPAAGQMTGISRTVSPGRPVQFEFLRIESRGAGLAYVAQPGGRPPVEFPLVDAGPDWMRFENRTHDFPQRIEYRREGESLVAEVSGPADAGEAPVRVRYRACAIGQRSG